MSLEQPAVLEQPHSRTGRSNWRQLPFIRSLGSIVGAAMGLLLVLLIFGAWRPDRFLTAANATNVLKYNYHFAVAAVGATFVIINAGIDLSVGSTMALPGVACALAVKGFTLPDYDPVQALVISG